MTTTPVMTITDEQIAEIERDIAAQSALKPDQCEGGVVVRGEICRECGATPKDSCRRPLPKSYAVPANITALISSLRAAEKDAERYRALQKMTPYRFKKIQDACITDGGDVFYFHADRFDAAIDAAMEQSE